MKRNSPEICRLGLLALLLIAALPAWARMQGQLNLNSATATELEGLPATGPDRAGAIVDYRNRNGRFTSLEQLQKVPGIGPRTFAAVRPYVKLAGASDFHSDESPSGGSSPKRPALAAPTNGGAPVLLADGDYFPVLLGQIQGAKQRIDLAMFVFKTGDSANNRPAQLADALIAAQRRGVAVRVLLEREESGGVNPNNSETAERLRKGGVKVLFDTPQTTSHMKLVVIDGRHCLLGSHNLTQSALTYNHELSLWVDDPRLAAELLGWLDRVASGSAQR